MKFSFTTGNDETSIEINLPVFPVEVLPVAIGSFPVLTGIYMATSAAVSLGLSLANAFRLFEEQTKYNRYMFRRGH